MGHRESDRSFARALVKQAHDLHGAALSLTMPHAGDRRPVAAVRSALRYGVKRATPRAVCVSVAACLGVWLIVAALLPGPPPLFERMTPPPVPAPSSAAGAAAVPAMPPSDPVSHTVPVPLPAGADVYPIFAGIDFAAARSVDAVLREEGSAAAAIASLGDPWAPGQPSLYFAVWTTHPSTWQPRHDAFLESVYVHDPAARVVLLTTTLPPHFLAAFTGAGYRAQVIHIDAETLLRNGWYLGRNSRALLQPDRWAAWSRSGVFYSHLSDYLRFVMLYHYGGTYLDADALLLRPLPPTEFVGLDDADIGDCPFCLSDYHYGDSGGAGRGDGTVVMGGASGAAAAVRVAAADVHGPSGVDVHLDGSLAVPVAHNTYLAPGVMRLRRGRSLVYSVLESSFGEVYDEHCWSCAGPIPLTMGFREATAEEAAHIALLPREQLYPAKWHTVQRWFRASDSAEATYARVAAFADSIHLFGHSTRNEVPHASSVVGVAMARQRLGVRGVAGVATAAGVVAAAPKLRAPAVFVYTGGAGGGGARFSGPYQVLLSDPMPAQPVAHAYVVTAWAQAGRLACPPASTASQTDATDAPKGADGSPWVARGWPQRLPLGATPADAPEHACRTGTLSFAQANAALSALAYVPPSDDAVRSGGIVDADVGGGVGSSGASAVSDTVRVHVAVVRPDGRASHVPPLQSRIAVAGFDASVALVVPCAGRDAEFVGQLVRGFRRLAPAAAVLLPATCREAALPHLAGAGAADAVTWVPVPVPAAVAGEVRSAGAPATGAGAAAGTRPSQGGVDARGAGAELNAMAAALARAQPPATHSSTPRYALVLDPSMRFDSGLMADALLREALALGLDVVGGTYHRGNRTLAAAWSYPAVATLHGGRTADDSSAGGDSGGGEMQLWRGYGAQAGPCRVVDCVPGALLVDVAAMAAADGGGGGASGGGVWWDPSLASLENFELLVRAKAARLRVASCTFSVTTLVDVGAGGGGDGSGGGGSGADGTLPEDAQCRASQRRLRREQPPPSPHDTAIACVSAARHSTGVLQTMRKHGWATIAAHNHTYYLLSPSEVAEADAGRDPRFRRPRGLWRGIVASLPVVGAPPQPWAVLQTAADGWQLRLHVRGRENSSGGGWGGDGDLGGGDGDDPTPP